MRSDEIQTITRCHTFFKQIQTDWIHRTRTNYKTLEITSENEFNMESGGDCLIFDLLQAIPNAFPNNPEIRELIADQLKPDILLQKGSDKVQMKLELIVLKITNKIAKTGRDIKSMFKEWDKDGNELRK